MSSFLARGMASSNWNGPFSAKTQKSPTESPKYNKVMACHNTEHCISTTALKKIWSSSGHFGQLASFISFVEQKTKRRNIYFGKTQGRMSHETHLAISRVVCSMLTWVDFWGEMPSLLPPPPSLPDTNLFVCLDNATTWAAALKSTCSTFRRCIEGEMAWKSLFPYSFLLMLFSWHTWGMAYWWSFVGNFQSFPQVQQHSLWPFVKWKPTKVAPPKKVPSDFEAHFLEQKTGQEQQRHSITLH